MIDALVNFKDTFLNYFNLVKDILPAPIAIIVLPFISLLLLLIVYKIFRKVVI